MDLTRFIKAVLTKGLNSTPRSGYKAKKARISTKKHAKRGTFLPQTFGSLRVLWMGLILTLPLDLAVAPFFASAFQEVLLFLPQEYRLLLFGVCTLSILLPLAKEPIMQLALDSQGFQREAQGLSIRFQSLFSGLIGLLLLLDVARRVAEYGIEYAVGLFAIGLILFPTWYASMKKKMPMPEISAEHLTVREDSLKRSMQQFSLIFFTILISCRIGIFITVGLLSVFDGAALNQFLIVFSGGLVLLSGAPEMTDLFRVCRKCGLWSHRSFQIDNFCPGCATLALKSARFSKPNSRLSRVKDALEKLDRGIEGLKIQPRKGQR